MPLRVNISFHKSLSSGLVDLQARWSIISQKTA
jgi:hypothetical protein